MSAEPEHNCEPRRKHVGNPGFPTAKTAAHNPGFATAARPLAADHLEDLPPVGDALQGVVAAGLELEAAPGH